MKASDFIESEANITVRDPEACRDWYRQTFDAIVVDPKYVELDEDEKEGCVFLGWAKDAPSICLIPGDPASAPIASISCKHLSKAADYFARKGVTVSPIQQDRAGTRFFEIRDCEGNTVEFCEET
jgi:catechol 2,3-dioxygenase-like lactoylglutathione lyase family enzyme